ncbi:MAG: hypothetical protein ACOY9Y_07445 [Bacillota bacterium]
MTRKQELTKKWRTILAEPQGTVQLGLGFSRRLKLRFDQFLAPVYRSLELVNPIGDQLMQGRSRSFAVA